ncbi:MAG: 16S rRNA (cytosine(1402)-N(4))-methyltransferase RsmH [Ilumatobacteraceae bacterium]|nr:16S rRNA (cytosine(1402)-N(4))-methyltransferase RsmH [Ilumatobacteraceae bacterium]
MFEHAPVMLNEILEVFSGLTTGTFLDATLGGAGHAQAVLEAHPDIKFVGIDRDQQALAFAQSRLSPLGERVTLRHARFDRVAEVLEQTNTHSLAGALFDLGVSSPQLDQGERGFSYRLEAPLDMRMDQSQSLSALQVVNESSMEHLAQILRENADERFAGRIAKAIVLARPLNTTVELAEVVIAAIPAAARRRGGHPAKRTFQAIRIEVNHELAVLPVALSGVITALAPGARLAVLTYHSGEDRITKSIMRQAETGGCTCPANLSCVCGRQALVRRVRTSKTPSDAEQTLNRRSTAARLRVIERLETGIGS